MTEGARSHLSTSRKKFFVISPEVQARTDVVLEERPKKTRTTLLKGAKNLLDKWDRYLGFHPTVLYPDPQKSNEQRVRVHGNSTPLEVGSEAETSDGHDSTK